MTSAGEDEQVIGKKNVNIKCKVMNDVGKQLSPEDDS